MAVKTITKYVCDICSKEFENEKDLTMIQLPYKGYDCEGRGFTYHFKDFDVCEECKSKYINIVRNNFADISKCLGNISVKQK